MLPLLYFPDEHKAAIYMPLFSTIGIPFLAANIQWWKKNRERRKKEEREKMTKEKSE
jgi:GPI-anchor transamidase subunit S